MDGLAKSPFELTLNKMPEGGYVVSSGSLSGGGSRFECGPFLKFAASDIDEALKYIKKQLGTQGK